MIACSPVFSDSLESEMKPENANSERKFCRNNLGDREIIIECINRGLYDPCDDAGGRLGRSQCIFAHTEIAERRIIKSRKEIIMAFKNSNSDKKVINEFIEAENKWEELRESSCKDPKKRVYDYGSCYKNYTI